MKEFLKKLKGWRTMLIALAISIVGLLQAADLASIVKPAHVPYWLLGLSLTMAVLRWMTTTPWGTQED